MKWKMFRWISKLRDFLKLLFKFHEIEHQPINELWFKSEIWGDLKIFGAVRIRGWFFTANENLYGYNFFNCGKY